MEPGLAEDDAVIPSTVLGEGMPRATVAVEATTVHSEALPAARLTSVAARDADMEAADPEKRTESTASAMRVSLESKTRQSPSAGTHRGAPPADQHVE